MLSLLHPHPSSLCSYASSSSGPSLFRPFRPQKLLSLPATTLAYSLYEVGEAWRCQCCRHTSGLNAGRITSSDFAYGQVEESVPGERRGRRKEESGTKAETDAQEILSPLPTPLQRESLPTHVAIIMDGNSRWARARGLPVYSGHEAGLRTLREVVNLSVSWGIRALTVFAFSTENWLRPKAEVDFLMSLFEGVFKKNLQDFLRHGIRVCVIGDRLKLPKSLQYLAKEAEEMTRDNSALQLIVALSYSGRSDIVKACQQIAVKVKGGILDPADVTESLFAQELETNYTSNVPDPDLLIRTSGELRLSNFLLWQSAYTELFFSDSLWPDFGESDYIEALLSFQQRKRRFGRRTLDR